MKKMQISTLQKVMVLCMMMLLNVGVFAQGRIELNSNFRGAAQLSESSLNGFNVTFSYNAIETEFVETNLGNFSRIILSDAVASGEVGAPSLPITKKLIAVPFGATPTIKVVGYTTSDYNLSEYGIERVYPQQPSYSKDTKLEDVEFQYNEKAYNTRAFSDTPDVKVELIGTMRGVQIASLQVEPIDYNPANEMLRVYNDINLEVNFDNADVELTKKMYVDSYSPYFDVVYKQMFNSKTVAGVFEEYEDLYRMPVYMTVVANSIFEEALKPWLEWKMQKGFYIDVKYVDSETSSSVIKSYIKEQYDNVKPSFLVIVGDENLVVPSLEKGQETSQVTDLYYGSVDGDMFPDVYYSRMSCETVEELEALVEKVLQYEKYTMPDPSYLNDALFIAGVDDIWNSKVGVPAVNYATSFFFNQAHGLNNVYKYTNAYDGCYDNMNKGVGFVNYTAHGVELGWSDPAFNTDDVKNLTNENKYFWAMGNCCLTGDWGSDKGPCLGEAFVRADKKGAWGYIGSCPVSYWNEDYYFAVGATTVFGRMPNMTQTEEGAYEMFWEDNVYNALSSVPFVGNLSVTNAHAGAYTITTGIELLYYWEAYHTIGDGTVMPYRTQPAKNEVSHAEFLSMGYDFYTVSAEPSSYVALSKDGVLLGTAKVGRTGSVDVPIIPVLTEGYVTIVVTHPQRAPYIKEVQALPTEGPYLSVYDYSPKAYPVNQDNKMTLTMRNVGNDSVNRNARVTLSSDSEFLTFSDSVAEFTSLASKSTLDLVDEFTFFLDKSLENMEELVVNAKIEYDQIVCEYVADTTIVVDTTIILDTTIVVDTTAVLDSTVVLDTTIVYEYKYDTTITIDTNYVDTTLVWNNKFAISVQTPVIKYEGVEWDGTFEPGGTYILHANFKNIGQYKAVNAVVKASSSNEYITIKNATSEIGTIEVDSIASFDFEVTIDETCTIEERIPIEFTFTADNDVVSEGSYVLKNLCTLKFTLQDSYGDGWGKSAIEIKYSDDTPTDTISIFEGKELVEEVDVVVGTTVTVSFIKEKYNSYECSYLISYKDGDTIYVSEKNIKEGVNCEFVVDCYGDVDDDDDESINEFATMDLTIYPNPAKDVVNVRTNAQRYEYQLINTWGQVVLNGRLSGDGSISVKDINNGVYFLRVVADGEMSINRIVINK